VRLLRRNEPSTYAEGTRVVIIMMRPSERGEHRPTKWGRRVCGGLSFTLGVARRGRSAGCVLCALWAVSAAVCVGGYPVGVSIS